MAQGKIIKFVGETCQHHHFKDDDIEEVTIKYNAKISDERQIDTIAIENSLVKDIRKFQRASANKMRKQLGSNPVKNVGKLKIDPAPLQKTLFNSLIEGYKKGVIKAESDLEAKKKKMQEGEIDSEALEALEAYAFIRSKNLVALTISGVETTIANGIADGKGTKQIARELRPQLEDLHTQVAPKYDEKGNLIRKGYTRVIPAKLRAEMIARTEVIQASNLGRLNTYAVNGISKVEGVVAGDERTCDLCMGLIDGKVYTVNEAKGLIPVHTFCRCVFVPVLEGI